MNITNLLKTQIEFDKAHGWIKDDEPFECKIDSINKDIIGIIGELGEFANIVKKINLDIDAGLIDESRLKFYKFLPDLKEEVIDIFIYLLRIMYHIDINVEEEYLKKLEYNKERFESYEIYKPK